MFQHPAARFYCTTITLLNGAANRYFGAMLTLQENDLVEATADAAVSLLRAMDGKPDLMSPGMVQDVMLWHLKRASSPTARASSATPAPQSRGASPAHTRRT